MAEVIRIVQASDLSLHAPLESAGVLPAHLREVFNQARERAALQLFESVIEQEADLLLLTGNLLNYADEPRLSCFLFEQFRRLRAHDIQIVWATHEYSNFPDWMADDLLDQIMPGDSVSITTLKNFETVHLHWYVDQSVVRPQTGSGINRIELLGTGETLRFVYHTAWESQPISHPRIPLQAGSSTASQESGFWQVSLTSPGPSSLQRVPNQTLEWKNETVVLDESMTLNRLLKHLQQRSLQIELQSSSSLVLVSWRLIGHGPACDALANDTALRDLLIESRDAVPSTTGRVWGWKIELRPDDLQLRLWSQEFTELNFAIETAADKNFFAQSSQMASLPPSPSVSNQVRTTLELFPEVELDEAGLNRVVLNLSDSLKTVLRQQAAS